MKSPKKALIVSYALFGIMVLATIVTVTVFAQSAANDVKESVETIEKVDKTSTAPVKESKKPSYASPNANEPTEVTPTQNTPQVQISENKTAVREAKPAPQKTVPLERIPFTNKDVTPGNPESYVDTYGQCPFYENAGPKGCVPPPDIECNADWSHCEYVGTKFGE